MMKNEDHIQLAALLARYIQGTASKAEQAKLFSYAADDPELRAVLYQYKTTDVVVKDLDFLDEIDHEREWEMLTIKLNSSKRQRSLGFSYWKWTLAAASVLLLIGFFIVHPSKEQQEGVVPDTQYGHKNDVLPGQNRAILTFSDGTSMALDNQDTLLVSTDNNVLKVDKGAINYTAMDASLNDQINTIKTPEGGTYRLVLADGTGVWLNSDTELAFPVRFSKKQRMVKLLKGEAFFEVAQQAEQPFLVQAAGFDIQVLGTSFNVNTYDKESAKTILTDGKVMVRQGNQRRILLPGSAAICKRGALTVVEANVEEALSWREGYFFFDGKTLPQILSELARWYGVSVHYRGKMDQSIYQGGAKRNATLATVCKMLTDLSGRKFEIDGKTLIVK